MIMSCAVMAQSCGDNEYYKREFDKREYDDMYGKAKFKKRIMDLNLEAFMNCMGSYGLNMTEQNRVYYVDNGAIFLNIEPILQINGTNIDEICDDDVGDDATIRDFINYTNVISESGKSLAEAKSDVTIVRSNVMDDNSASERVAQVVAGYLPNVNKVLDKRRDGDITITFEAGGGQLRFACGIDKGQCGNKCSYTYGILLNTAVNGISYAAGWSHHFCTYKSRDNGKTVVNVNRKNYNYYIQPATLLALYSGGMSRTFPGNNWGDNQPQRTCGFWN